MGNNITFSPNSATPMGTIPKFVGHGSVLAHPDVIPVFWGPWEWRGHRRQYQDSIGPDGRRSVSGRT
jgi:hypothetical protein